MRADSRLLLVGGGRWARVYLGILTTLDAPISEVVVASRHGGKALAQALQMASAAGRRKFSHVDRWQHAAGAFDAALVVNATFHHAETAMALLDRGVPVLIEKPAALGMDEAQQLADKACLSGQAAWQAIALNYCAYLNNFVRAARDALGPPVAIEISWKDADESRYGESKTIDQGIGLADDVGPHIAALLSAIAPQPPRLENVIIARGGLVVDFSGRCGDIRLTAALERETAQRQRLVVLRDGSGGTASLDFSIEPGTMTINSIPQDADPNWARRESPLTLQLRDFLEQDGARKTELTAILATVAFSSALAKLVCAAQRRWLNGAPDAADRLVALRELLAPHLAAAGCINPGDNAGLNHMVRRAMEGDAALAGAVAAAGLQPLLGG